MKKVLILVLVIVGVVVLSACTTDKPNGEEKEPDNTELLQLTLEELAMYDGQDGNKAYIAVNGIVYDVTDVAAWTSGSHNGGTAGTDVSSLINNAPHAESVLDNLEVVGEIIE